MPIPILLPPQVNSPDHIWGVFMYLFLRYSQLVKSQPRHCLCQLLLLSPTPPLFFGQMFCMPPSGILCFLTQTNKQIGKLSFICYILGYSGCLEFMKMFPRVRGYVSILVAVKIKCPSQLFILAQSLKRNDGQQSIPQATVGKESLKDEAGILTRDLGFFLMENAALYNPVLKVLILSIKHKRAIIFHHLKKQDIVQLQLPGDFPKKT